MAAAIPFKINDESVRPEVDGNRKLLGVLRTELGLTGTKYGCGKGICGACTVLVNDRPARACVTRVSAVRNREVVTIEGLARNGELHPLQKAFMEHDALQCGFCTPGMILTAYGLLRASPNPSREDIIRGMERNLCRCGAHPRIIEAIQSAAAEIRGKGGR
jgi:aerobic-type carbon monoxide dehydrogenase small subunit (CoxS/CutS family)